MRQTIIRGIYIYVPLSIYVPRQAPQTKHPEMINDIQTKHTHTYMRTCAIQLDPFKKIFFLHQSELNGYMLYFCVCLQHYFLVGGLAIYELYI